MEHYYNIDCMEGLKMLLDASIDLVVTDPPYRGISGGNKKHEHSPSGILTKNDGKVFKYNTIKVTEWLPEVYRVLKEDGECYIMINALNMEEYLRTCREVGFKLHNILVWEKNNVTPNRWYMKNGEFVLYLYKGHAKPINNCGSKQVHSFNNITGNKVHPTQKPVEMMKFYIENSSQHGDTVLDPFFGSGSVGKACKETGRNFIGFEIDEHYYEIATRESVDGNVE